MLPYTDSAIFACTPDIILFPPLLHTTLIHVTRQSFVFYTIRSLFIKFSQKRTATLQFLFMRKILRNS